MRDFRSRSSLSPQSRDLSAAQRRDESESAGNARRIEIVFAVNEQCALLEFRAEFRYDVHDAFQRLRESGTSKR